MAEDNTTAKTTGRGDLFLVGVLIVASISAGYGINALRTEPLPFRYGSKSAQLDASVRAIAALPPPEKLPRVAPATSPVALPELTLEEFIAYTKARRGLILDVRPDIFYRLGHVPYAISLPRDKFEPAYALIRDRLETDHAVPLVVYCAGSTCGDASLVQAALQRLGFTHVAVFRGGWNEWTAAHLEEEHLP